MNLALKRNLANNALVQIPLLTIKVDALLVAHQELLRELRIVKLAPNLVETNLLVQKQMEFKNVQHVQMTRFLLKVFASTVVR